MRVRILALSILLVAVSDGQENKSAQSCHPSELSQRDAEQLVLATPEAIYAQQSGASPYVFFWHPTNGDALHFYFAEVDQRRGAETPLGNGLIGHFAVNRLSAALVSIDTIQIVTGIK